MVNLERLLISNNQLRSLPTDLPQILEIDAGNNNIEIIENDFVNLTSLIKLSLEYNKLNSLPKNIGLLSKTA